MHLIRETTLDEIHATMEHPEHHWVDISMLVPDTEMILLIDRHVCVFRKGERFATVTIQNFIDKSLPELVEWFKCI